MLKGKFDQNFSSKQTIREAFHESPWRAAREMQDKDKLSFAVEGTQGYGKTAELKEHILAQYSHSNNQQFAEWMRTLTHTSLSCIAQVQGTRVKAVADRAKYDQAIANVISAMFNKMRTFAYEFNCSIGWTELYVTCSIPGFVTETMRYNSYREASETVTNFRARISSKSWSVIIRGRTDKVQILIVPIKSTIGLMKTEDEHQPVLTLTGKLVENEVLWHIDNQPMPEGHIDLIAMELFASLVQLSTESMQSTDQQIA